MSNRKKLSQFALNILSCDRKAVGEAITLIESTRDQDRKFAQTLIEELLPHTGKSIRIGVSGAPGVGKSTFIEAFGLDLIAQGYRVAVLAIDPSSPKTGGSILGDKTRMEELSKKEEAFIRPSPSAGKLGGVAARTREVMLIVESAGFDIIIIETVGVGQSETTVSKLSDVFLLIIPPAGGDDLQGIKRGIVELSDIIIINKADGELLPLAQKTESDYYSALQILRARENAIPPKVTKCSALKKTGITDIRKIFEEFCNNAKKSGAFELHRSKQASKWMWEEINNILTRKIKSDVKIAKIVKELESGVRNGNTSPITAADKIWETFFD